MQIFNVRWSAALILTFAVLPWSLNAQNPTAAVPNQQRAAQPVADDSALAGTETIVFLRHGEKPPHGLGQINAQGLNRALALATVLPKKFGKPDFLFAPDPGQKLTEDRVAYNYVRPLATIEPTAVALGMPVNTPFGFAEIDKLNAELSKPKYANATIFVAWEHGMEQRAAANLVKQFGGNPALVPAWPGADFDSLYVVKITRSPGQPPAVSFTHEQEGLNHLSKTMPDPAGA